MLKPRILCIFFQRCNVYANFDYVSTNYGLVDYDHELEVFHSRFRLQSMAIVHRTQQFDKCFCLHPLAVPPGKSKVYAGNGKAERSSWHIGHWIQSKWGKSSECPPCRNNLQFNQFLTSLHPKTFPVTEISLESIGSNLTDARGLGGMVKMVWKQTWPLFKPPYLSNIMSLCYLTFVSFFVAHGVYMWYPQILALYYPNMHLPITTCEAVALARRKQENELIVTNLWVNEL